MKKHRWLTFILVVMAVVLLASALAWRPETALARGSVLRALEQSATTPTPVPTGHEGHHGMSPAIATVTATETLPVTATAPMLEIGALQDTIPLQGAESLDRMDELLIMFEALFAENIGSMTPEMAMQLGRIQGRLQALAEMPPGMMQGCMMQGGMMAGDMMAGGMMQGDMMQGGMMHHCAMACSRMKQMCMPAAEGESPLDSSIGEPESEVAPAEEPASAATMDHSAHTMESSVPFDAAFLDDMAAHHEGAIAMANDLLANTQRPELVELANAILATQQAEIGQIQEWRDTWYPDVPPGQSTGMEMGDMEVGPDETIAYEQRFLAAMIAHHEGAIEMADRAQRMAEHPEVKALAVEIIAAQSAEIEQMQMWLEDWFPEDGE